MLLLPRLLLAAALLLPRAASCALSGGSEGVCIDARAAGVSFCASALPFSVCVPRPQPWLRNLTAAGKDAWLAVAVPAYAARRAAIEAGALAPNDPSQFDYAAGGAAPPRRFSGRRGAGDCAAAFAALACYINFPRCDGAGVSLLPCRSACENLERACGVPAALSRCGDAAYGGAAAPEGAAGDQLFTATGNARFNRAQFPGQPFADNRFEADGETPLVVCTPSVANGAPPPAAAAAAAALALAGATMLAAALAGAS